MCTDVRIVPFWCFSFNVIILMFKILDNDSYRVSNGLHMERINVRPPVSPKKLVVFIQYYYRERKKNFINCTAR